MFKAMVWIYMWSLLRKEKDRHPRSLGVTDGRWSLEIYSTDLVGVLLMHKAYFPMFSFLFFPWAAMCGRSLVVFLNFIVFR